jgi:hypothetical protein
MPLLHCLFIYYTCDVNICVENGSWHTYAMHLILPLKPGVTPNEEASTSLFCLRSIEPIQENYIEIEKILYAILKASRKLQHSFQSHHIIVSSLIGHSFCPRCTQVSRTVRR